MTTFTPSSFAVESRDLRLVGDRFETKSERGVAILLHGGAQTRHSWSRTADRLRAEGWTAITFDARGHGNSGWAPDRDYSTDSVVRDLKALVDACQIEPVLVGASMGGLTSLVAVGEGAVRARGLILVDVTPRVEASGLARIVAFMSAHPDGFATVDEVVDAIAAYNPHRRRPSDTRGVLKNVRQGPDGRWRWHWDPAIIHQLANIEHRRLTGAARNVEVPTMVVRGADSDVVSSAGSTELLDTIPGAIEVVVPAAGHMIVGDDNDLFGREVRKFLSSLPDTGPTPCHTR